MIIAVTSSKGGVGKTTTAVHLAAYLQTLAPCLRLDGDTTKNATSWSERGDGFGFRVAGIDQAAKLAREYQNIVIDTGQRPSMEDLRAAVDGCDLLVVPAAPASLDTDGLGQTVRALQQIGTTAYRVLLTKVPPPPEKEELKAFEKAAATGRIVRDTDERNAARAWDAYTAAGRELTA